VHDALHHGEMTLPGIMHMETDLLDDVDDVGAGELQVLEGTGEAPELSQISNNMPGSCGDLGRVSMDVETGLRSTMPVRSRTSRANWH
jgi:hypothetical protein